MMFFLFVIIPFLTLNSVLASPVLLWSNANLPRSSVSLSTVPSIDIISNYICQLSNEQIQVRLFAVNDLTNEDIQRGLQSQHSVLVNARKASNGYRYFPNVADDAYKTFSLLPQSNNMKCAHIHFQQVQSTTYGTLHDALNAIQASVDTVGVDSKETVVLALTGTPGVARQHSARLRRDIAVDEVDVLTSDDDTCMFYANKLYWEDAYGSDNSDGNFTLDTDASSCTKSENGTSAVLELHWNNGTSDSVVMTLIANLTGRYWYLEKAIVNDTEYRYFAYGMHSKMDTPPAYSYVCTRAVFIKYDPNTKYGTYDFTDKFYLANLQFQPFHANGTFFGPPNYCTSFFTSGIWMGITSSLLCLGILLFGVYRMMSIKSNDQFDDPKGKPLIIKAQE
ncbi:unnamed protein product [Adineta ricciae]|uniref:V-type proton ATPase subunit S1/VOA1 transmembrane domain-containing protein n=1 Tax=Adineta ricciae TaxID=249248 RepID=A0A816DTH9_ADIRI|nr:unnamed protein product [Adineta ricciae]